MAYSKDQLNQMTSEQLRDYIINIEGKGETNEPSKLPIGRPKAQEKLNVDTAINYLDKHLENLAKEIEECEKYILHNIDLKAKKIDEYNNIATKTGRELIMLEEPIVVPTPLPPKKTFFGRR